MGILRNGPGQFGQGDDAFRFLADIHKYEILVDPDDFAGQNGSCFETILRVQIHLCHVFHPLFNLLNDPVRRRSASRNSCFFHAQKHFRRQFRRRFHMIGPNAGLAANLGQVAGIGAVLAADHHHHVHLPGQLHRRRLALCRGAADRWIHFRFNAAAS